MVLVLSLKLAAVLAQFVACALPAGSWVPRLAWPHHPALVTFGLRDIEYRWVCLSPPWVILVLGLRVSAVRRSSLGVLSRWCR